MLSSAALTIATLGDIIPVGNLVPGINYCTNSQYHADKIYLSSSVLKTINKSLDEYHDQYINGNKKEYSERTLSAFGEGSYVHSLILEPEVTAAEFAIYPGWRKQGLEFENFKADNAGKTVMSLPQKERCDKLIAAYKALPEAAALISEGLPEHTLAGILHGVPIKVRADWINVEKGYIVDVKTTGYSSDIDSFKEVIKNFEYDLSAALYTQMFEEFYGKTFQFYFLVLSKMDNTCDLYRISNESMAKGRLKVAKACRKFKNAAASGVWTEGAVDNSATKTGKYEILEV